MSSKGQPLTKLARGLRDRTSMTVRLAGKVGLRMLAKTLDPSRARKEVDEGEAVEAARELLEKMSQMKGLVMKFGQMASYLGGAMPPAAQQVLARLQDQSTPMAFEAVGAVIESELGARADELFDDFEREPFAAASIGQVHRASYRGRPVAVKVQYPDIAEVLDSDLRTIGAMVRLSLALTAIDGGALLAELRDRIAEECDYVREAANQRLFRRLLASRLDASVPRVVEQRSTRRVFTADFVDAATFSEFSQRAPQEEKNRAGATIFDVCFTCIFNHCVFNADPHPGNYLFRDGEVVFLDFGCIKRFSVRYVDAWKRFARSVLKGDKASFREASIELGHVGRMRRFDWDHHWELTRYLYEPFLQDGFTFTTEYVKRSYDVLVWKNPNRFSVGMPRDGLLVNRLQWGLNSVLAHLNASGPWPELLRRAVETPTIPVDSAPQPG